MGNPIWLPWGMIRVRCGYIPSSSHASPQTTFSPLELNSSIFALETFQRDTNQTPGLLAVTENGLVQLFREQENRPPLLTEPVAKVEQGQYTIGVAINDVEGDEVDVQLEVLDPQTGQWVQDEVQTADNGNGTLFWPLAAPPAALMV